MRISLKTISSKVHSLLHWCSWKGWLYLTTFIITSSHLYFSQRFLPRASTVSNQIESIFPEQAWRNGQVDVISSSPLQDGSTIFTTESENIKGTLLTSTKSIGNDENNETKQQRMKEHFNNKENGSLSKEKEIRYWQRSERIKRVCHKRGVISNPSIFTISKKSLPNSQSPNLTNFPGE